MAGFFSTDNAFFSAGIGLLVVSSLYNSLQSLVVTILGMIWRSVCKEVVLSSYESPEPFRAIMQYLQNSPERLVLSEQSKAVTENFYTDFVHLNSRNRYDHREIKEAQDATKPPVMVKTLGKGRHILRLPTGLVYANLNVDKADAGHELDKETLSLTAFGPGSERRIFDFIQQAVAIAHAKDVNSTIIYDIQFTYHPMKWTRRDAKPHRSMDSVILDSNVGAELLSDLREFLRSNSWYKSKGVPYRRSYMLYGPPGSGKTSFVAAIAAHFNLSICVLSLSDQYATDNYVNKALLVAPKNSLILIEDIDAAFPERPDEVDPKKDANNSRVNRRGENMVTFSGVLNALDGIGSGEGRVIFMTTNHYERITDPAILRPGRIDRPIKFDLASNKQKEGLFLKFYEGETALAQKFAAALPDNRISMAQLQGHFLMYKDKPLECFDNVSILMEAVKEAEAKQEEAKKKKEAVTKASASASSPSKAEASAAN